MQRVRTVSFAALALAGVLTLGACSTGSPGTAATVSGTRLTVSQVNAAISELGDHGANVPVAQYGSIRQRFTATYVFTDLAKRYAAEKGYPAPKVDYAGAAQSTGLPQNDTFLRLIAEAEAYRTMLLSRATPAQPSEAELHLIFDELVSAGVVNPQDYARVRPQILQLSGLTEAVGLRGELVKAVARYHVNINPLYLPQGNQGLSYPLFDLSLQNGQQVPLVTLPLSTVDPSPVITSTN